jgi:hypothetical protein
MNRDPVAVEKPIVAVKTPMILYNNENINEMIDIPKLSVVLSPKKVDKEDSGDEPLFEVAKLAFDQSNKKPEVLDVEQEQKVETKIEPNIVINKVVPQKTSIKHESKKVSVDNEENSNDKKAKIIKKERKKKLLVVKKDPIEVSSKSSESSEEEESPSSATSSETTETSEETSDEVPESEESEKPKRKKRKSKVTEKIKAFKNQAQIKSDH